MPGAIPAVSSAYLYAASGVGAGWQATSYKHVSAREGYVLWTRGDTGQAALWEINPSSMSTVPATIPITASAWISSPSGVGGPWQATSFAPVDATTAYVLWTRGTTGVAALWKVDPSAMPATIPITSSAFLYSPAGVGAPWRATNYEYGTASSGYVLWSRADTGEGAVWKVDPSVMPATIPILDSNYLYSISGVGGPWQATGYVHGGLVDIPTNPSTPLYDASPAGVTISKAGK
jgi:hypothetical protein